MGWYWATDLAAMQHAARRYPSNHPAGQVQSYQHTDERAPHLSDPDLTGAIYRYHPPTTTRPARKANPMSTRLIPDLADELGPPGELSASHVTVTS